MRLGMRATVSASDRVMIVALRVHGRVHQRGRLKERMGRRLRGAPCRPLQAANAWPPLLATERPFLLQPWPTFLV